MNLTGKYLSQNMFQLFLSYARVNHHVHQCVEQPAEDVLRQDDRRLAHLQPPASLHRGSCPHIHGHTQVDFLNFFF